MRKTALIFLCAVGAACSKDSPTISDDLKQDLARVGGGDVLLAGSSMPKLEIVSSAERVESAAPSRKTGSGAKALSTSRGARAAIPTVRREAPAVSRMETEPVEIAPVEVPRAEPPVVREPAPAAAGRPTAPQPSTQREPAGGWRSPSDVIRNAPFPINP